MGLRTFCDKQALGARATCAHPIWHKAHPSTRQCARIAFFDGSKTASNYMGSRGHNKEYRMRTVEHVALCVSPCNTISHVFSSRVLAREYGLASTGARVLACEYWRASTGARVLAREYWRENTVERVLAREYWRASTAARVLARQYCRTSTGARVLACEHHGRVNTGARVLAREYCRARTRVPILLRECWRTSTGSRVLAHEHWFVSTCSHALVNECSCNNTGARVAKTANRGASTCVNVASTCVNVASTCVNVASTGVNVASTGVNVASTGVNVASTGVNVASTCVNTSTGTQTNIGKLCVYVDNSCRVRVGLPSTHARCPFEPASINVDDASHQRRSMYVL